MVWHQVCHTACHRTPVSPQSDPCARSAGRLTETRREGGSFTHPRPGPRTAQALRTFGVSHWWRFLGDPRARTATETPQRAAHPPACSGGHDPRSMRGPPTHFASRFTAPIKGARGTEACGTAPLSQPTPCAATSEVVAIDTSSGSARATRLTNLKRSPRQHGHWSYGRSREPADVEPYGTRPVIGTWSRLTDRSLRRPSRPALQHPRAMP